MTTEIITITISKHVYDGTPETLPPVDESGWSRCCMIFSSGKCVESVVWLADTETNEYAFSGIGEDESRPFIIGTVWFLISDLDQIATAKPTAEPESDLRPCPFCGSTRVTVRGIPYGYQAVCKDCKATGAPVTGWLNEDDIHREAATAWNTRADTKVNETAQPSALSLIAAFDYSKAEGDGA